MAVAKVAGSWLLRKEWWDALGMCKEYKNSEREKEKSISLWIIFSHLRLLQNDKFYSFCCSFEIHCLIVEFLRISLKAQKHL